MPKTQNALGGVIFRVKQKNRSGSVPLNESTVRNQAVFSHLKRRLQGPSMIYFYVLFSMCGINYHWKSASSNKVTPHYFGRGKFWWLFFNDCFKLRTPSFLASILERKLLLGIHVVVGGYGKTPASGLGLAWQLDLLSLQCIDTYTSYKVAKILPVLW